MSETETTPLSLGALRDLAARIGRPVDVEDRNTILRAANEIEMLRAAREDTERPDDETLEIIEGLFRAGLRDVEMSVGEQERLVERTERVLERYGRKLPTDVRDTEQEQE